MRRNKRIRRLQACETEAHWIAENQDAATRTAADIFGDLGLVLELEDDPFWSKVDREMETHKEGPMNPETQICDHGITLLEECEECRAEYGRLLWLERSELIAS